MGYKYNAGDMLDAAIELALSDGLSALSFGRLAKQLGIADRSIVYYFPSKADLVTRTVGEIGTRLQVLLDEALGTEPLIPEQAIRQMWNVLATPTADPVMAIFFELVGLAAASIEPYDSLTPALVDSWVDWLTPRLKTDRRSPSRHVAYATVAQLDGLLLIRHTSGQEAAHVAAVHLGMTDDR